MAQLAHLAGSFNVGRPRTFTVRCNRPGRWTARDLDGLIEGVFIDKKTAIRFALFEAGGRRSAVNFIPDIEAEEGARAPLCLGGAQTWDPQTIGPGHSPPWA